MANMNEYQLKFSPPFFWAQYWAKIGQIWAKIGQNLPKAYFSKYLCQIYTRHSPLTTMIEYQLKFAKFDL